MEIERINKIAKTDIKESLKKVFPQVFEDNKINFEKLKELLSGEIIKKEDDRFYFNWAGKSKLFKLIQSPAYGTLKPDKERSVDFDNTENIVIVGENLETLKLLLKPYFGKVKMIYIDPPYNTGKDFIYNDNFKEPLKDYLEKTGQIDSEGNKLTTNTEASGRYHSDWLNFMYSRLFLARSLLRDDGVIFISIDDNEVHHLRMLMDEVFGEENFVANFVNIFSTRNIENFKANEKIPTLGANLGELKSSHEYVLCYRKTSETKLNLIESDYKHVETRITNASNNTSELTLKKGIRCQTNITKTFKGVIGGKSEPIEILSSEGMIIRNGILQNDVKIKGQFRNPNYIIKIFNGEKVVDNRGQEIVEIYLRNTGVPYIKKLKEGNLPCSVLSGFGDTSKASRDLEDLFGKVVFNYPKPLELIKHIMKIGANKDSIVLDFFAGSGTTGHAVWDLNKEDGGNRKFILVQLDEEVQNEEVKKKFPTVADICIERLRRVSEKYKKEIASPCNNKNGGNQDFGFKVFRLDKSNFNLKEEFEIEEGEDAEELKKKYLEWLGLFVDQPLVSGWQEIDVIYEVMLKEGLNLNSKIEQVEIKENNFYYVKDSEQNLEFYICLGDKISNEVIEEIRTSKYKGKMFVFLDKVLTDNDKINLSAFVRLKVI